MTRQLYLAELKRRLRALPADAAKDALSYYEGYLDDAGEREREAMFDLGTPRQVAAQLMAEHAVRPGPADGLTKKRGLTTVWFVILAVFAAPVGLPIAAAVAAVALSLLIVLFAVLITFGASGAALLLGGLAYLIVGALAAAQNLPTALTIFGFGLAGLGFGILFLKAAAALVKHGFPAISRFVGRVILRRERK